jgi:hypothetical protein
LERAKGLKGSYGISWYEKSRQRQQIIGEDLSAASAAKIRKATDLKRAALGIVEIVKPEARTLAAAVETFIIERTDLNPTTAGRWRGELDLFNEVCGKHYLSQLTREDVFAYRKCYADHGRHGTTIANRTSSLFTFCRRFDILWQQFTKSGHNSPAAAGWSIATAPAPQEPYVYQANCGEESKVHCLVP